MQAGKKEIVRRYFNEMKSFKLGQMSIDVPQRIKVLMNNLEIDENYLEIRKKALETTEKKKKHVASIKLPNKKVITGKETELLSPVSSVIINSIKVLTNIPDEIRLIPENVLKPILDILPSPLDGSNKILQLPEVLIALSICSVTNPTIENALKVLSKLNSCDLYVTYIISESELKTLKSLGINVICEPKYHLENAFIY